MARTLGLPVWPLVIALIVSVGADHGAHSSPFKFGATLGDQMVLQNPAVIWG